MRLLVALLLSHLLGGCAVQVYMQKPQQRCRVVYDKGEGVKQVCDQGDYFRVKDIYFGSAMKYMAEQTQTTHGSLPPKSCVETAAETATNSEAPATVTDQEKQELIRIFQEEAPG